MSITIYDENIEWVFSTSAGSLVSSDNTNPHTGLIDLSGTAAAAGDNGKWTAPSPIDPTGFTSLSIWLDPSGIWSATTSALSFFWLDSGGTQQGSTIQLKDGAYGIVVANKVYQNAVIPMTDFGIPAGVKVQALGFSVNTKTTLTFFLDTITLAAVPTPPTPPLPVAICNLNTILSLRSPWSGMDEQMDLAIQIGMMCDALNGVPITVPVNIPYYRAKVCCLSGYGENQLRGIWTTLFAMLLNHASLGVAGSNDVVYDGPDPTTGHYKPPNTALPAIAYSRTGIGSTYGWDPISQTWN